MTIVVSHAMRRYSPPSPSGNYFVHRVGEDPPCQSSSPSSSPHHCDERPLLPRSMRLSEPWLYGSLRAAPPAGFFLTPALVLCTCPEYINGTKRSSKKGPTICKKCKGTRLPLHMLEPPPPCATVANKYGTMRCYPPGPAPGSVAFRSGTARVSSSSRPSILPTAADPYDFLRRSRTASPDYNASLSKRSKSPGKSLRNDTFSLRHHSGSRGKFGTAGRKSILECEINPYDLVGAADDGDLKEKNITFLNGQRIRVRPPLPEHDYEDVDTSGNDVNAKGQLADDRKVTRRNSGASKQLKVENSSSCTSTTLSKNSSKQQISPSSPSPTSPLPKPGGGDTYKSILKKTTDSQDSSRSSHRRSRSNFYLPVRKKVQFLDENGVVEYRDTNDYERVGYDSDSKSSAMESATSSSEEVEEDVPRMPRVHRSVSERFDHQNSKVKFNDTMALRTKSKRKSTSNNFSSVLVSPSIDISFIKSFPKNLPARPPPPLPPSRIEEVEEEALLPEDSTTNNEVEILEIPVISDKLETVEEKSEEDEKSADDEKFEEEKQSEQQKDEKVVEDGEKTKLPPTAPPRKKNNKISVLNTVKESPELTASSSEDSAAEDFKEFIDSNATETGQAIPNTPAKTPESPILSSPNKTIVQIRSVPDVHKIQIKTDYPPTNTIQSISIVGNGQRKTSIMINGDNCYSTVNVNDDTPLYLSSVVVSDANTRVIHTSDQNQEVKELSLRLENCGPDSNNENKSIINVVSSPSNFIQKTSNFIQENNTLAVKQTSTIDTGDGNVDTNNQFPSDAEEAIPNDNINADENLLLTCDEDNINESNLLTDVTQSLEDEMGPMTGYQHLDLEEEKKLKEILRNPVEAVKLNLVPHVCGKSDVARRHIGRSTRCSDISELSDICKTSEKKSDESSSNRILTTFAEIYAASSSRQDSSIVSTDTGNSSMHYETMEHESDFYTDTSNRSSVAEDDSTIRSKFYELLAESAITELSENDDHQYESIRNSADPIYEEIEVPPPLPTSPPPKNIIDDLQLDKQITTRSIFEGASKYDILSYLVDAKERGIVPEDTYVFGNSEVVIEEESLKEPNVPFNRVSHMSTISDSSEDSSLIMPCTFRDEKTPYQKSAEVERNDSGVGSETSKASLTKYRNKPESSSNCEDCETSIESETENEALLCRKCMKRRSERKEIITEIVETEEKYSRDLQIILEEFYQPMLVAGLLTQDQLSAIFLNVEELLENSQALAERLRDAVEIAVEQGDEDLLTVNIGKLFLEAAPMLHAFETYCVRQAGASLLLASLEKDKELLRIFLRVSQMENTMLRRMNLNSFLMVPVQRVTKYPLLLARLYKATPAQHGTREQLMEAKHQIELHLNHMNSETKDVPSKLWRRIGSSSGRRLSTEMDLVSIKLRKIAVDVLEWNHEEAKFALEGKLLFTQPTDNNWRKGRTIKLTPVNALLVTNGKGSGNRSERLEDDGLRFPRNSGIREAALLLVRDKNGRYSLLRDPLYLDRCVIATDPSWHSYFEVQEVIGKDTFIFKAEDEEMTQSWYKELQFHAQGLGIWRKRRNALANIMINGMGLRT